jgi:hypothetical protein
VAILLMGYDRTTLINRTKKGALPDPEEVGSGGAPLGEDESGT